MSLKISLQSPNLLGIKSFTSVFQVFHHSCLLAVFFFVTDRLLAIISIIWVSWNTSIRYFWILLRFFVQFYFSGIICMAYHNSLNTCFLNTQGQISKKQFVKKDCQYDKACQLSALQGISFWSYSEKQVIGDKYISKQARLVVRQAVCVTEITC